MHKLTEELHHHIIIKRVFQVVHVFYAIVYTAGFCIAYSVI